MAQNLTPKQEAFALAFLETSNAAEAYRRAYDVSENARDSWIYVEACQLLDNPKVAQRVKELQDQAAALSLYTAKAAFEEYESARKLAETEKNPSAAVSAINGKVKLFGLEAPIKVSQRTHHSGSVETRKAEDMTDDELAQLAGFGAAGSAGTPPASKGARKPH